MLHSSAKGNLRCYNLFPTHFGTIEQWTQALDHIQSMGFNAVWVNPFVQSGEAEMSKTCLVNGVKQRVKSSLYAMKDPTMVDARFSVVARDEYDCLNLMEGQIRTLKGLKAVNVYKGLVSCTASVNAYDYYLEAEEKYHIAMEKLAQLEQSERQAIEKINQEYENHKEIKALNTSKKLLGSTIGKLAGEIKKLSAKPSLDKGKNTLTQDKSGVAEDDAQPSPLDIKIREKKILMQRCKEMSIRINEILNVKDQEIDSVKHELQAMRLQYEKDIKHFQDISKKIIQHFDYQALKVFTSKAKLLGLTPIFDLVMNHVSNDAPIVHQKPRWFSNDNTYLDATGFKYGILTDKQSADPKDVKYLEKNLPEMITFWKKIVERHVKEWGFAGARVDCVRKVPKEVRKPIYEYIKEQVSVYHKGSTPVILEEALFSNLDPKEFAEVLGKNGASHITGSSYYSKRLFHGGLDDSYAVEDGHKQQIVEKGVVNFTGNHDHHSMARTALFTKAYQTLQERHEQYLIAKRRYNRDINHSQLGLSDQPYIVAQAFVMPALIQSCARYIQSMDAQLEEMSDLDLLVKQIKLNPQDNHLVQQFILKCRETHEPKYQQYYKEIVLACYEQEHQLYTMMHKSFADMVDHLHANDYRHDQHLAGLIESYQQPDIGHQQKTNRLKNLVTYCETGWAEYVDDPDSNERDKFALRHHLYQKLRFDNTPKDDYKAKFLSPIFEEYFIKFNLQDAKSLSEFSIILMDGLVTNALAGSGGYYLLSGDEFGSFYQPSVFLRKEGTAVYPRQRLDVLINASNQYYELGQIALDAMSEKLLKSSLSAKEYDELLPANKARLMVYAKDEMIHRLSGGPCVELNEFFSKIQELSNETIDIEKEKSNFVPVESLDNGWNSFESIQQYINPKFVRKINQILEHLPEPNKGYWGQVFKTKNHNVIIAVRKNGMGVNSETDVVIVNLDPHQKHIVNYDEIHKLACWFQERLFPTPAESNPDYHKAYWALKGENGMPAPRYHFAGNISLDEDVTNSSKLNIKIVTPTDEMALQAQQAQGIKSPIPKPKPSAILYAANAGKCATQTDVDTTKLSQASGKKVGINA